MRMCTKVHFGGKEVIDMSLKSCVRFSARNYVEVMWMANLIANGVKIVYKDLVDGKEVLVGIQTNRDLFPATAKWNAPVKAAYADLLDVPVHIYDDAKALEKTFAAFCGMAEVYKCCHVITYREPSSITNIIHGKQPIIAISDLGMVIVLSSPSEYRRFNKPGYRFFGPAISDR